MITIYGLIDDCDRMFYIGTTRDISQRMVEHNAFLTGVQRLRYTILGRAPDIDDARRVESALCRVFRTFDTFLTNQNYYVDKTNGAEMLRRHERLQHYQRGESLPDSRIDRLDLGAPKADPGVKINQDVAAAKEAGDG